MSWVWFLEFTSYYRKWGFSTVINSSFYIPKRIILQFWLYHYSTLTHFDYINFTYFFPSLYCILVFLESIPVSCSPSLPLPLLSSFSCSLSTPHPLLLPPPPPPACLLPSSLRLLPSTGRRSSGRTRSCSLRMFLRYTPPCRVPLLQRLGVVIHRLRRVITILTSSGFREQ